LSVNASIHLSVTGGRYQLHLGPPHDFWASTKSETARAALELIGKLYENERDIKGQPADVRRMARQSHSLPKNVAFFAWSEQ
jgi:transposase